MRIGIISDTHDNLYLIERAVELFNREKVDFVFHAGDYIAPFVAKPLSHLNAKLIGVFGNNDGDKDLLKQKFHEIGFQLFQAPYEIQLEKKKILLIHMPDLLYPLIKSKAYDVIIYGHTHKLDIRREETLVINPGEAGGWLSNKPTVVVLDLESLKTEVFEV